MAHKIVWTSLAADDLEEIARYISRDSHNYACGVAERVMAALDRVATFPNSGPVLPEMPDQDNIRQVIVQSWRVIYRVEREAIRVIAVLHGARLLDSIQGRLT
jgi:toxin ParE1/3/4